MANLKFADTHNMVAFLSKPTESEGFEQIVDFLKAHPIKYALTINPTIYISCIEQFRSTGMVKTINREQQLHALVDGKKVIITESTVRRDLQLEDEEGVDCLPNATIFEQLALMGPKTTAWNEFSSTMASAIICLATNQKFNFSKFIFESMTRNLENVFGKILMYPSGPTENVADEAVHKELGDSLVRAATTASSLEAEQDSGNITKTRSKATPNESSSLGTTSGGNTLRSEDILKLNELMELCTNLQKKVLDLEKTKTTQANEIANDADNEMFDVGTVTGDEVFAEQEVAAKDVNLTTKEITLAQALAALKSVKPKVKGDVIEEPSVPVSAVSTSTKVSAATTTTATILTSRKGIVITELGTPTITRSSQQPSQEKVQDKGKEKMIELEKPMKKKDLIRLDEEIALNLQAEFDEEGRLEREKDEANVALTEE
ncbi:hypothetical protein Tco_1162719 [Tanacetum coccineum]